MVYKVLRIASVLWISLFALFVIGEGFTISCNVPMFALAFMILGLLLMWRLERIGGIFAIMGFAAFILFNQGIVWFLVPVLIIGLGCLIDGTINER